jgi:hypothetical protein
MAARGVESTADTIPWDQVGPGWVLATWTPLAGHRPGDMPANEPDPSTVSTTLYLVDPDGGRYPVATFPPMKDATPQLVDWSGDKNRALFTTIGATPSLVEVDLHTGKHTPITLADPTADARYTLPDGKALLLTTDGYQKPATLNRVDLTGKPQLNYPVAPDFSGVLSTADGTQLVIGTDTGLLLMGNDGKPGATLPIAGPKGCRPLRWWDAKTVLARCGDTSTQLWRVPVDGGAPTALTAVNDGQKGPDYGDANAWQLPAGTFVQDLGACGVIYLAKLNADGTTTEVKVPDVQAGSVEVVGINDNSLRLHAMAACGGGQSLVDYDPSTNATTVLLGPPVNGGGVVEALAFKGQR